MPGSTSTSGIGKFSASTRALRSRGVELAARVRAERAIRDFGERAVGQAREISSAATARWSRDVQAAVGRQPLERAPCAANDARRRTRWPRASLRSACTREHVRPAGDRGNVGLRLAADVGPTAAVIASATGRAMSAPQSAKSEGPEPDRLQPRAPASTAARLIARNRVRGRAARLGDRVLERTADLRKVSTMQAIDERPEIRPLPYRIASGTVVPSSARAFAVSISRSG